MTKSFIFSALMMSAAFLSSYTQAQKPSSLLSPKAIKDIDEKGDLWIKTHIASFDLKRNQMLMSFLSSFNEPTIAEALEAMQNDINTVLNGFIENLQKKLANKKLTKNEEEELAEEIKNKLIELANYISASYITKLSSYMEKHTA